MFCYLEIPYWIGLIWIISKIFQLLREFYIIICSNIDVQKKYGKGCWALITGATDGIGKGFCEELAKQGVNICIIARNKEKADKLVQELKNQKSKSEFKIVITDFNQSAIDKEMYKKIFNEVKQLDIGLLINNVGVIYSDNFERLTEDQLREIIIVNCFPIVLLTRTIIPLLLKRKNKSAIINLASGSAVDPVPYIQVYSASKAFDDFFSRALSNEYSQKIDILSLRPYYVTTQMTGFMNKWGGAILANECARGCLQRLQQIDATHGHLYHRLQGLTLQCLPEMIRHQLLKIIQRNTVNKILIKEGKQKLD